MLPSRRKCEHKIKKTQQESFEKMKKVLLQKEREGMSLGGGWLAGGWSCHTARPGEADYTEVGNTSLSPRGSTETPGNRD